MGRLCEKAERGITDVASRLNGLHLQVALQMVQEADDGDGLLELGLEFGNQRHGLGVEVVEVEDQQRGPLGFGRVQMRATASLSPLTNSTFTPSLRAVS